MSEQERDSAGQTADSGAAAAPSVPPPPPPPAGWWVPPPPPPAHPAGGVRHPWRWVIAVVLTWAIIAGVGGMAIGFTLARAITATRTAQTHTPTASPSPSALPSDAPITAVPPSNGQNGAINVEAITAKVGPAIVDINTVVQSGSGSGSAAGTGMIVTPSGQILTNNHVVNGSTSITITIEGRSGRYPAHVIGVAPNADVALLQIEGVSNLPTVTMADSYNLQVGDAVVAIGNALGQGTSATQGHIVALNQDITASTGGGRSERLTGLIQSDASISPGDSGGALVNSAGQVIGMITAGEATSFRTRTTTVAYSIPTNTALGVVNQIRAGKASDEIILGQVGYLGVTIRDLSPQLAAQLGLSLTSGALVWTVQPGSPAEAAGIAQYSVITTVGSRTVTSTDSLGTALHQYKPGAKVRVTWIDPNGTTHTAIVTLTSGPNI